jgi:hypothetical protein
VPSNPVFINFYWPSEDEIDDYFPMKGLSKDVRLKIKNLGLKHLPVTVNLRPIVDVGFTGDALYCLPGQNVSIDLKAYDPEGFPVTVFRRAGQIGTIERNRFTARIPSTDQDKIYRVHFIFSDGTGGYTGKQIKLLVVKERYTLPEDWAVTVMGQVQSAVHVNYDENTFTFGKQLLDRQASPMQGTFVFQPIHRAADLMCRIPWTNAGTEMALMITNTLDDFSRRSGIGFFKGKISAMLKSRERGQPYQWDVQRSDKPEYFRLTLRDDLVAAYISADNKTWEQVMVGRTEFFKQCYAGLIYRGNPWATGVCQWLSSSRPSLPILTTDNKTSKEQDGYNGPLEITIASPDQGTDIRYTLDGSEPTAKSQMYLGPIKLTQAGRHEIRVKAFQGGLAQDTAIAVYHLKPVTDKP